MSTEPSIESLAGHLHKGDISAVIRVYQEAVGDIHDQRAVKAYAERLQTAITEAWIQTLVLAHHNATEHSATSVLELDSLLLPRTRLNLLPVEFSSRLRELIGLRGRDTYTWFDLVVVNAAHALVPLDRVWIQHVAMMYGLHVAEMKTTLLLCEATDTYYNLPEGYAIRCHAGGRRTIFKK